MSNPLSIPRFSARARRRFSIALALVLPWFNPLKAEPPVLAVPGSEGWLHFAIPLPENLPLPIDQAWSLVNTADPNETFAADRVPALAPDGTAAPDRWHLAASISPGKDRFFKLEPAPAAEGGAMPAFSFFEPNENSLGLKENDRPVFVYNHGLISREGVPRDRTRGSYLHPIYGLNGETLTDDFPEDHYHHRGLFWAWPHVGIGERNYDLWMLRGIRHQFEQWLTREAGAASASIGLENAWFIGDRKVVQERVWLRLYPSTGDEQILDVDLIWIPLHEPLTLRGAEGKSYGGLTLRYAPNQQTIITVPSGRTKTDLHVAPLPWADLSGIFQDQSAHSGASIFIDPAHPNFPPTWLTRHYGVLCVGWPGVQAATFPPGRPFGGRYRIRIHKDSPDAAAFQRAYRAYQRNRDIAWIPSAAPGRSASPSASASPP